MSPTALWPHPKPGVAVPRDAFDRCHAYRRAATQCLEAARILRPVERSACVIQLGFAISAVLEHLLLQADCDEDTDGDPWSSYLLAASLYPDALSSSSAGCDSTTMRYVFRVIEQAIEPIYGDLTPHERITELDVELAELGARTLFAALNAVVR